MSELLPTRIVDRNGKITTVHKRQGSRTVASKSLSAAVPSISRESAADRYTATPLVQPSPLTSDEVTRFDDQYFDALSNYALDRGATSRDVFIHQLDGVTQAHVREALKEGVSVEALDRLLFKYREAVRGHSVYEAAMPRDEALAKLQTSIRVARKLGTEFPMLIPSDGAIQAILILAQRRPLALAMG